MLEPEQSLHPLDGNNRQQRAAQNQPVETAQDSCDSVPETLYKPGCRHGVLLRMVLMFVAQTPDRPKGCDAMSTLSNLRPISVEAILCTPPSTIGRIFERVDMASQPFGLSGVCATNIRTIRRRTPCRHPGLYNVSGTESQES